MAGLLLLSVSGCSSPEQVTAETRVVIPGAPSLKSVIAGIPVTITYNDAAKKCAVSYKKTPVYAAPEQTLHWLITNECVGPDKVGIDVKDFRIQFDADDPTIHGNLKRDIKYLDTKHLVAVVKLKGFLSEKAYPYHFYIGEDQQSDPDIIIEFETFFMLQSIRTGPPGTP